MARPLSERQIAANNGAKKYFTGEICRNGHVAERYTLSGACVECLKESQAKINTAYSAARAGARTPESDRFVREVVSLRQRVPLAMLESVQAILRTLLAVRFPTIEAEGKVKLVQEGRPSKIAGGTGMVGFWVHRDDIPAAEQICRNAMEAGSARGVPPILTPLERSEQVNARVAAANVSHSPMRKEFIP